MARMNPRARSAALAVLVWVAVIAVGSSLVWLVVSRAGAGLAEQGPTAATAPAPSAVTTTPGSRPTRTAGARPGASGASSGTPSAVPSSSTPVAVARQRTWTGPAGVVTVECRGGAIALVGAYPSADGYVVEVKDRGPDRVEVEFEGRSEQEGAETRVRAECGAGGPVLEVDQERD